MTQNEPEVLSEHLELDVAPQVKWGTGVVLGPNCREVRIGFGCFVGNDIYIDVERLTLGDYVTIHHGGVVHGKRCAIGHNCWIGHYTILDSLGGRLAIGNNVGIGAHSQIWSHMKFGDVLAGCRWQSHGETILEDDVWLVGHCVVAPIRAAERSMLMVGGVAVRDMAANRVYAGTPAKDVTERMGPQFRDEVPYEERAAVFAAYLEEFAAQGHDVSFVRYAPQLPAESADRHTWFGLQSRTYRPRYTDDEHRLMKFLLYDRAKFVPQRP